ncbi:MFS transporter [Aeromicrobium camelliae]|uniref:MFS transporter n=1 Tax=Aeromicrobium camelliae TaxID=1538144 RepID=A0A3N6XZK3_9ACTN|nr:Cmx/CmrA family chloramphenicol efflux MFS transporter [Aeromicrobium camelliae]RQN03144.1 MFS transporter [Aeromicrobium camelliae]
MPFVLYLLALAVFVMLAGLLPAIAADLGVTVATAGLLTSAFAAGMVVGAPVMAAFARRWPPRRTLLVCLVAFAALHVVGAVTDRFPVLLAARVFSAVANAGFLAVALNTATRLVPEHRKGRALAVLLSGTTIATVAGVPAGAMLGTAVGWRATFWAIALLCIPAAVGVLRGVDSRPVRTRGGDGRASLRAELAHLTSPRLLLAMGLGALVNAGTFAVFTFLAPVVTEVAALADVWVPVALVMFGVGSFVGVTLAGRLSDQRPCLVLAGGAPLLLAGWILLALSGSHPVALMVMILVQGAMSFGVGSTLITRVLYAASNAPTMAGAYATASLNVGAVVGPVLGALGLAAASNVMTPVWVAVGLTTAALIIMLAARGQLTTVPVTAA